jgi:predicted MFS family arabinose efflux permease
MIAIVATFGMNLQVLVPVFTKTVLGGAEAGFGLMMSFVGAGSLCGALGVAVTSDRGPRRFNLFAAPVFVGVLLILTGLVSSFFMYAALLFVTGFFFVSFSSSSNSNVQISADDKYRGRVMSLYALIFSGCTPIGNLYTGFFSDHFGVRVGYIACGVIILVLIAAVFLLRFSNGRKKVSAEKH